MKTGTVILAIILILAASWTGLGYLINMSSTLQTQNNQLLQDIRKLEVNFATEQQKNRQLQVQLAAMSAELASTKSSLATETSAKDRAMAEVRLCKVNENLAGFQTSSAAEAVVIPITIGSTVLGILGLTKWLLRRLPGESAGGNPSDLADVVVVKLTRQQLSDFIRYQRQRR